MPPAEPPSPSAPATPAAPRRWIGSQRAVLLLAVIAAVAALVWPRDTSPRRLQPGGFLIDASGRPQPLAREFRHATLVHFWASWCPPCLTEIPAFLAYAGDAVDDRLAVVLVAVSDEPNAARRFLGPTELPLLFDPGWEVAHRFGTDKLPETHLVVGGDIVETFVGATDWRDPDVRARVQKWIASPPSASP